MIDMLFVMYFMYVGLSPVSPSFGWGSLFLSDYFPFLYLSR